jgi:hypothetical protein
MFPMFSFVFTHITHKDTQLLQAYSEPTNNVCFICLSKVPSTCLLYRVCISDTLDRDSNNCQEFPNVAIRAYGWILLDIPVEWSFVCVVCFLFIWLNHLQYQEWR